VSGKLRSTWDNRLPTEFRTFLLGAVPSRKGNRDVGKLRRKKEEMHALKLRYDTSSARQQCHRALLLLEIG